MPTKVRIITNAVSDGARALGESLEALGVDVSRVRANSGPKAPRRLNIKWGCFGLSPVGYGGTFVNSWASDVSLNKLTCFQHLQSANVRIPEFTDSLEVATRWLEQEGCRRVYQRNILRGSEGDGIVVVETTQAGNYRGEERLSQAPLYTKGLFGHRREYRIHVFKKDGIKRVFVQQKMRRATGVEQVTAESRVRNLANGWIFAHNEITQPRQQTIDLAVAAVTALNLDFGAIDLIEMHEHSQGSYVLEVNCAPGLQGGTLNFYANAINDLCNDVVDNQEEPPEVEEEPEYIEDYEDEVAF